MPPSPHRSCRQRHLLSSQVTCVEASLAVMSVCLTQSTRVELLLEWRSMMTSVKSRLCEPHRSEPAGYTCPYAPLGPRAVRLSD